MWRLKRWWYLSNFLTIIITTLNLFNCLVKLYRNLKLKFRSKFNHEFYNHGYLHNAVSNALYNFKIKRAQEARYNHSFFQNVQNYEISEIFKVFKSNNWINFYYNKLLQLTFTTCSPWAACSIFDWKYVSWVNLVQNLKIISFS